MTKTRLEAFSDGVFAIVITLLILDVHIPQDQPLTLASLGSTAPHLLAFVLSFVIVGLYWVAHHSMIHFVKQVDRQILWLNHGAPPALRVLIARLHSAPIPVYALAIALAHWYVPAGLVLFAAVPVFFILPNPFIDNRLRAAAATGGE